MGELCIVGIGPGSYEDMTLRAVRALEECDCIVGYELYTGLVRPYFPDKEYISTPMGGERERCLLAIEGAQKGKKVCLVCSGDPCLYGMASLVFEQSAGETDLKIKVIPGVSAAFSGSALVGAPLSDDCCFISLSDIMTPWETIEKRLLAAAGSDFIIVLYNPGSSVRKQHLKRACEILLVSRPEDTVCAAASNIGRDGERFEVLTLAELKDKRPDMLTTVWVGSSRSAIINGRMVTSRGY